MGRFEPQHDLTVLIVVIGEVLRTADPDAPEQVSQRRYDAAREAAGHGGSPRADKLTARFGVTWAVLRDRVLHHADPSWKLTQAAHAQDRRVLTKAEAVSAVRRVAARRGTTTLTSHEYDETRNRMSDEAARRWLHGTHLVPLPSAAVINQAHGFRKVATAAGLDAPSIGKPALPRVDAIVAFVEHYGFLPTRTDIEGMARHHGIQLVNHIGDPLGPARSAARERFEQSGRWFPPEARNPARPDKWKASPTGLRRWPGWLPRIPASAPGARPSPWTTHARRSAVPSTCSLRGCG